MYYTLDLYKKRNRSSKVHHIPGLRYLTSKGGRGKGLTQTEQAINNPSKGGKGEGKSQTMHQQVSSGQRSLHAQAKNASTSQAVAAQVTEMAEQPTQLSPPADTVMIEPYTSNKRKAGVYNAEDEEKDEEMNDGAFEISVTYYGYMVKKPQLVLSR